MRLILSHLILLLSPALYAQQIIQGPVIGALTANSARVYLRSEHTNIFKVELSANENFKETSSFQGIARENLDNSAIISIENLQPNTLYYYRIYADEQLDSIRGNFRTFPAEGEKGEFTFVTGSCQESENMKVFDVMPKYHPYFLLHTGDYTYPDYQIRPDYSEDYGTVAYSYQRRYDEKVMKEMLGCTTKIQVNNSTE